MDSNRIEMDAQEDTENCVRCGSELQLYHVDMITALKICPNCLWPIGSNQFNFIEMGYPFSLSGVFAVLNSIKELFTQLTFQETAEILNVQAEQQEMEMAEAEDTGDPSNPSAGSPYVSNPWVNLWHVLNISPNELGDELIEAMNEELANGNDISVESIL